MMSMEECERFIEHVNAPEIEGGHGWTLGIDAPIVGLAPSWHYHEHVHVNGNRNGMPEHTHKPREFGEPEPPDARPQPRQRDGK